MVAFLLLSSASMAGAQDTKPVTRISQELAEIGGLPSAAAARGLGVPSSSSPWLPNVGDRMTIDGADAPSAFAEASPGGISALPPDVAGDWVTIDAVAAGDPTVLEAELLLSALSRRP